MIVGLSKFQSILIACSLFLLVAPLKASQTAPQGSITISNLLDAPLTVNMDECNGTTCKPCHYCTNEGSIKLLKKALSKISISGDDVAKNIQVYGVLWKDGSSVRINCPLVMPSDNKRVVFKKKLITRKPVCVIG